MSAERPFRRTIQITLGIGIMGSLGAMIYAGGLSGLLTPLASLTFIPYALLIASLRFAHTTKRAAVLLAVCVMIVAFSLYSYVDALFIHLSSTSGLVFLGVPVVVLVPSAAIFLSLFLLRAKP